MESNVATEPPQVKQHRRLFRTFIFWIHLVAGLIAAPIILIMSVTGVLLTYEKQIEYWANTRYYAVAVPPDAKPASIAELVAAASQADQKPTAVTFRSDKTKPAEVSFGRDKTFYLNPYTAEILGTGSPAVSEFFHKITDWHRWLGAPDESRAVGKAVTGVSNVAFFALVLTGFYLWFPRRWSYNALRNITWFRGNVSGRARFFNWHNTIGFWCTVPLIVVVFSAIVISFPWAGNMIYRVVGEEPPPPRSRSGAGSRGGDTESRQDNSPETYASLQTIATRAAEAEAGWKSLSVQLPTSTKSPVAVNIDAGTGGQPQKRSTLEFDPQSAEVIKSESFATQTTGRKIRSLLRFAHTGEVAGLLGQTIAGIASLGAVFLVCTGAYLSWRRWRSRRSSSSPA